MRPNLLIFLFTLATSPFAQTQSVNVDSLILITNTSKNKDAKLNAYNELFLYYEFINDSAASHFLNNSLEFSKKINYFKGLGKTYTNFAYFAEDKGDLELALNYYNKALINYKKGGQESTAGDTYNRIGGMHFKLGNNSAAIANYVKALKLFKHLKNNSGIADTYANTGLIYNQQGNYPQALKNYFYALKMYEKVKDDGGLGSVYNNIAVIYKKQEDYEMALKYNQKALEVKLRTKEKKAIAASYRNIGVIYKMKGNFTEAMRYYQKALVLTFSIKDLEGLASCYSNIGNIQYIRSIEELKHAKYSPTLDTAILYYSKSLILFERIKVKSGIAGLRLNLGNALILRKNYVEGELYIANALKSAHEVGDKAILMAGYKGYSELDSIRGDFKRAFEHHKLYIGYKDSLNNEDTKKQTIQTQMTYDFEKKEAIAKAEHKKELENQKVIANEKTRKQNLVTAFVGGGLVLVLLFAVYIFRSLKITRKQKTIIELQKHEVELQKELVEEKQREVMDSIRYAKRIQVALLPSEKNIKKYLNRFKD